MINYILIWRFTLRNLCKYEVVPTYLHVALHVTLPVTLSYTTGQELKLIVNSVKCSGNMSNKNMKLYHFVILLKLFQ